MQVKTVLAIPSDTHNGSPVGLMPSGQWQFTNGGFWHPNFTQIKLEAIWRRSWGRVAEARKDARLIVVHAGDAVEGLHHDSTQVVTMRMDEQERIHETCMDQALQIAGFDARNGDLLYYVQGTSPTHSGPGGEREERIARDLGAVPKIRPTHAAEDEDEGSKANKDGCFLWERLLLDINGKLFDIAHHGANLGTRPWTRDNPFRSILKGVYFNCLESGARMPDYWVRAHKHTAYFDIFPGGNGHTIHGYITPAMQTKTEFVYKIAPDAVASVGMIWFTILEDGTVIPDREIFRFVEDKIERV